MLLLESITVSFQDKQIVNGVSLKIAPATIHALMGPNGSGKSTLSLALSGYPYYEIGKESKILLDEKDIMPMLPHERAKAGLFLAFQSPVAISGLSVKQIMKTMVDHLRQNKVKVADFLTELRRYAAMVGIKEELLDRGINDGFSGGEKKRLEMLALLMATPKYAILDELDSGLDVDAIKMMTKAIQVAQKEFQTGFLIVTHYRRILEFLPVDAVHILTKGKIIRSGKKELIDQVETSGYQGLV